MFKQTVRIKCIYVSEPSTLPKSASLLLGFSMKLFYDLKLQKSSVEHTLFTISAQNLDSSENCFRED